jgi:L-threonylcarbamoyladenylate synthase
MSELVSIERDGAEAARAALERTVLGGGVAIFPADTLYGLACDPSNGSAIDRIHGLKDRVEEKSSAVMFFSPLAMRELVSTLGAGSRDALGALLPGPVTLVVDNPGGLYPLACREDASRLGVRLIEGPLGGANCAIFQTSANRSGEPAPGRFDAIEPRIVDAVDLAIDGGEVGGDPSTVVDITEIDTGGRWRLLREGAIPGAQIAVSLGEGEAVGS